MDVDRLSWAVLLAKWIEFAKGVTVLDDQGDQGLFKASVTDIIMLQAIWFALAQAPELEPTEQALAIMRSGVLIEKHVGLIENRWANTQKPSLLIELIEQVNERYHQVKNQLK